MCEVTGIAGQLACERGAETLIRCGSSRTADFRLTRIHIHISVCLKLRSEL